MKHFIVFRKPGRGWVEGKPTKEQPGWDDHAKFMDALFDHGKVILAGPYEDYSRVLQIVSCTSQTEAEHLYDADPWTEMGILEMDGVHPWLAFLKPAGWPT